MSSSPGPTLPRLARYAGVVLNALTALAWGGIAALQATTTKPLYAVLSVVLVVLYTMTAWGFLQRNPSAYGRSFRVHAVGLLFDIANIVMVHTMFYLPLAVLHGSRCSARGSPATSSTRPLGRPDEAV